MLIKGDRATCVDVKGVQDVLEEGEIYTIAESFTDEGTNFVTLEEQLFHDDRYLAERFVKV